MVFFVRWLVENVWILMKQIDGDGDSDYDGDCDWDDCEYGYSDNAD